MRNKVWGWLFCTLALLQLLVVLLSWFVNAMGADRVISLLSPEGIRWFFSCFTANLCSPLLVWLLLCTIAWGALQGSGLFSAFKKLCRYLFSHDASSRPVFRERLGLMVAAVETMLIFIVMVLLTAVPHAILLNAEGGLLYSPFSVSLLPVVCFWLVITSVSFACTTGRVGSVSDITSLLCGAFQSAAPWLVVLVLGLQLYCSCLFVSGRLM